MHAKLLIKREKKAFNFTARNGQLLLLAVVCNRRLADGGDKGKGPGDYSEEGVVAVARPPYLNSERENKGELCASVLCSDALERHCTCAKAWVTCKNGQRFIVCKCTPRFLRPHQVFRVVSACTSIWWFIMSSAFV